MNAELISMVRSIAKHGADWRINEVLNRAADALESAEKRIADLEAQLPKEGEWIDGDARKVTARCSVCGHLRLGNGAKWANMYVPFCEICGAKMKGENDGEEKD